MFSLENASITIITIIIVIIIIIFNLYNHQDKLDTWDSCKVVRLNLLYKFSYPFTYFSISIVSFGF